MLLVIFLLLLIFLVRPTHRLWNIDGLQEARFPHIMKLLHAAVWSCFWSQLHCLKECEKKHKNSKEYDNFVSNSDLYLGQKLILIYLDFQSSLRFFRSSGEAVLHRLSSCGIITFWTVYSWRWRAGNYSMMVTMVTVTKVIYIRLGLLLISPSLLSQSTWNKRLSQS